MVKQIEDFYMLYNQDIYIYLLSLTRDPTLSEDLLSETFANAIKSIGNFKGKSSVKTWLFSIARNLWLQRIRNKKNTVCYNDLLGLYVSQSLEEQYITKETANRIKKLLSKKDKRTQKVVKMRVEGYSYAEIADKVNISEGSARVINFRTKKWIKEVLEEEGGS